MNLHCRGSHQRWPGGYFLYDSAARSVDIFCSEGAALYGYDVRSRGPEISRKVRVGGPIDLGSVGGAVRVGGIVQLINPPFSALLREALTVPSESPCPRQFTP